MEIRSVSFSRAAYKPEDFPRDGRPQFAIVGRSNVGKSSLINTIFRNRTLARVSQTPGKTQAIHFYNVNDRFYVVDLPGYGFAKVPREIAASWGTLTRSYFGRASALRILFLLVDSRRIPSEDDFMLRDWASEMGVEWRVVMTKVDKLSKSELAKSSKTIAEAFGIERQALIEFSKVTRNGANDILREIAKGVKNERNEPRGE